eukprot:294900-Rhodomonas_salina.1
MRSASEEVGRSTRTECGVLSIDMELRTMLMLGMHQCRRRRHGRCKTNITWPLNVVVMRTSQ